MEVNKGKKKGKEKKGKRKKRKEKKTKKETPVCKRMRYPSASVFLNTFSTEPVQNDEGEVEAHSDSAIETPLVGESRIESGLLV